MELPPEPWSVFEDGPYRVGYQRGFEVTYDAVGEPNRTFNYVIWYPTFETEGEPAKYIGYLRQDDIIDKAEIARMRMPSQRRGSPRSGRLSRGITARARSRPAR